LAFFTDFSFSDDLICVDRDDPLASHKKSDRRAKVAIPQSMPAAFFGKSVLLRPRPPLSRPFIQRIFLLGLFCNRIPAGVSNPNRHPGF
jgi:hypothetical protein